MIALATTLPSLHQVSALQVLEWAISKYRDRLAITTSFQAEGMVVIDMAARVSRRARVLTLDTGRLPVETHEMMQIVRARYGINVETVSPDPAEVENMVQRHGADLFYESVPKRLLCCEIRKVRPLERIMRDFDAWVVGLRRGQSATRDSVETVEQVDGRVRVSPLATWTRDEVEAYIREHDVPRHPLYSQGYTSIGCAPCTRATEPGEDERAGRWWWENGAAKECGIHFTPDGKAVRAVDVLLADVLKGTNA